MRHLKIMVIAMAVAVLFVLPAYAGARVALVVGNADYATLGHLANPESDADAIAATLAGMGFQVSPYKNLTANELGRALSQFSKLAKDADIALVYYAGHGLQLNSENYLVGVDATLDYDGSLRFQTTPLDDVLAATQRARSALIYVDACRTIPAEGTFLAEANERAVGGRGPAPVNFSGTEAHNTLVGFSASVGQTALDGSGRNSPFTIAMVESLPTPGVSVTEMFDEVSGRVVQATFGKQKPQFFSNMSERVALVAQADVGTSTDNGPAADERAYADAKAVGTLGAYRAFVARFPAGFYTQLASEMIDKLVAEQQTPITLPEAAPEAPAAGDEGGAADDLLVASDPTTLPVAKSGLVRHPRGSTSLVDSPSDGGRLLETLPNRTPLTITQTDGDWYAVTTREGDTGFVRTREVKVDQFVDAGYDKTFITIASFSDAAKATAYAHAFSPAASAYLAINGWYAVTLAETYDLEAGQQLLGSLRTAKVVGPDAFQTVGNGLVMKVCCD